VPDASVDAVLAGFALPHLGRPEQAAAEFVRVLAPGGTVALSTWDDPGRARLVGVFVEALAEVGAPAPASLPPGQPFFRFADRDELCRLLTGAGLTGVSVSTVAFNHRFAGPDALWDGMMSATVRTRDSILGQAVGVQAAIRAAYDRRVSPYVVAGGALELPVSVTLGVGRRAP
jgi:SAM-dependent methyltransferase